MASRTRAQHNFAQIPSANIQRSSFNRSCGLKTTFNAGLLIPIFVDEALPGDTMEMRATSFGRLATLLHPVMENLWIDYFFFFVPNRLVWDNWQKFCGEQKNPGDSVSFNVPQVTPPAGGWPEGSVADYFGIPTQKTINANALHFRALNLVYNEWFRDENLQVSRPVSKGDGPDAATDYILLRRGKRHDYFSSALPWPQKGAAVTLPMAGNAVVERVPNAPGWDLYEATTQTKAVASSMTVGAANKMQGSNPIKNLSADPLGGLIANMSTVTAATINQLREAFQVQRMYERDARGGTRYTEMLRSHFGVVSPDARLQRPEYLGGGRSRVSVNQVASSNFSTAVDSEIALGDLGAFATFAGQTGFRKSFVEHGVLIGLCCLDADLNYQQGLDRMWSRRTRFDYYWPSLAHLGEQSIKNIEIYANGDANDALVFGYQERYAEYRYKPSLVTGAFRSNAAQPLDAWHLAQSFTALPVLNASFIEANPPVDRIVAVTQALAPHCLLDMFFQYRCTRPMPVYGVPGLIDHF